MLTATLLAFAGTADATEVGTTRPFGLGVALGEPTAVVGKVFTGPSSAWDGGIAFFSRFGKCRKAGVVTDCDGDTNVSVNGDFLWLFPLLNAEVKMDLHVGAGARLWLFTADSQAANFAVAARVPFGIDFTFNQPEFLEAFIEMTPALVLAPGIYLNLEWAIGARFYF